MPPAVAVAAAAGALAGRIANARPAAVPLTLTRAWPAVHGSAWLANLTASAASPAPSPTSCPPCCVKGTSRLDPRPDPGVPRPARGRLLAPVQHRVPGGLPRRHQLPGLPQP